MENRSVRELDGGSGSQQYESFSLFFLREVIQKCVNEILRGSSTSSIPFKIPYLKLSSTLYAFILAEDIDAPLNQFFMQSYTLSDDRVMEMILFAPPPPTHMFIFYDNTNLTLERLILKPRSTSGSGCLVM